MDSYTPVVPNTCEQDRGALQTMRRFLGLEHFGWKLPAILTLICSILMTLSSLILMTVGVSAASGFEFNEEGPAILNEMTPVILTSVMGGTYLATTLLVMVPICVIDFIMMKKVEYYESTLDTDVSIARKRCTSVGMIVFCVLFSNIAAVFYIINFVKTKNNAAAFDRLEAAQQTSYSTR